MRELGNSGVGNFASLIHEYRMKNNESNELRPNGKECLAKLSTTFGLMIDRAMLERNFLRVYSDVAHLANSLSRCVFDTNGDQVAAEVVVMILADRGFKCHASELQVRQNLAMQISKGDCNQIERTLRASFSVPPRHS
jgi:hypothetical protein